MNNLLIKSAALDPEKESDIMKEEVKARRDSRVPQLKNRRKKL